MSIGVSLIVLRRRPTPWCERSLLWRKQAKVGSDVCLSSVWSQMLPRGFYQVTMIDLDSSNPIDIPLSQVSSNCPKKDWTTFYNEQIYQRSAYDYQVLPIFNLCQAVSFGLLAAIILAPWLLHLHHRPSGRKIFAMYTLLSELSGRVDLQVYGWQGRRRNKSMIIHQMITLLSK